MERKNTVRLHFIFIAIFSLAFTGSAYSKDLGTEIKTISGKLSKKMVTKGIKKAASIDFVDLQGRTTELGRYLAEQLSVEMVNEDGISVVDRANIKNILAEHKLTLAGLVEPENARKLGRFAGIDAIITGTVTTLDGNVVLTVKAISTETAQIVAAAKATFKNTQELQQLSNRAASSPNSTGADADSITKAPQQNSGTTAVSTESPLRAEQPGKQALKAGPLVVTADSVRTGKRGARVFLTIDSKVTTSLEIVKGILIDSEGTEVQIAHSMRTDITSANSNQITVEAANSYDNTVLNLKPPFDLSIDLGLAYGTMDAKTLTVSFHGLKL